MKGRGATLCSPFFNFRQDVEGLQDMSTTHNACQSSAVLPLTILKWSCLANFPISLVSCFQGNLISILLKIPVVDRPCLALARQCRRKKKVNFPISHVISSCCTCKRSFRLFFVLGPLHTKHCSSCESPHLSALLPIRTGQVHPASNLHNGPNPFN